MQSNQFPAEKAMCQLESPKAPYETPQLTEYGSLADLTLEFGSYYIDGAGPFDYSGLEP